jgi:hypothetical protein
MSVFCWNGGTLIYSYTVYDLKLSNQLNIHELFNRILFFFMALDSGAVGRRGGAGACEVNMREKRRRRLRNDSKMFCQVIFWSFPSCHLNRRLPLRFVGETRFSKPFWVDCQSIYWATINLLLPHQLNTFNKPRYSPISHLPPPFPSRGNLFTLFNFHNIHGNQKLKSL